MKSLNRINNTLQKFGGKISGVAILAMMGVIVVDVFMRNIFKSPVPGSYVIIESFLMPIAIFPALGYVYMVGVLPRLNDFVERTPQWFQKFNKLLLLFMDAVVFTLLTYFTFVFFTNGYAESIALPVATKSIPLWPIYFFVPLGYVLVLLEVILRLISEVKMLITPKTSTEN